MRRCIKGDSINISKPGITKGQHWHNSKWELFIVVAGHGLIQERNINTGETVEFEVSGDKIEAIHMIPGWTHNIINLSETEIPENNEIVNMIDSNPLETAGLSCFWQGEFIVQGEQKTGRYFVKVTKREALTSFVKYIILKQ